MKYNKLVRDKIPQLIKKEGYIPITRILSNTEYKKALELKLEEETQEYLLSEDIEELADILEVIYALANIHGINQEQLMQRYQDKHLLRGGFKKQIYLIAKEK